jgi:hypothetical protein
MQVNSIYTRGQFKEMAILLLNLAYCEYAHIGDYELAKRLLQK